MGEGAPSLRALGAASDTEPWEPGPLAARGHLCETFLLALCWLSSESVRVQPCMAPSRESLCHCWVRQGKSPQCGCWEVDVGCHWCLGVTGPRETPACSSPEVRAARCCLCARAGPRPTRNLLRLIAGVRAGSVRTRV